MEIIIGKSKATGKNAPFGTHADAVQVGSGSSKKKLTTVLGEKQDNISDLATIRTGASKGATAYQKPSGGIPKTDLATAVQTSLGKADSALQSSDLNTLNGKVSALEVLIQSNSDGAINKFNEIVAFLANITDTQTMQGIVNGINTAIAAKYTKPSTGIPKSDLKSDVQEEIDNATNFISGIWPQYEEEHGIMMEDIENIKGLGGVNRVPNPQSADGSSEWRSGEFYLPAGTWCLGTKGNNSNVQIVTDEGTFKMSNRPQSSLGHYYFSFTLTKGSMCYVYLPANITEPMLNEGETPVYYDKGGAFGRETIIVDVKNDSLFYKTPRNKYMIGELPAEMRVKNEFVIFEHSDLNDDLKSDGYVCYIPPQFVEGFLDGSIKAGFYLNNNCTFVVCNANEGSTPGSEISSSISVQRTSTDIQYLSVTSSVASQIRSGMGQNNYGLFIKLVNGDIDSTFDSVFGMTTDVLYFGYMKGDHPEEVYKYLWDASQNCYIPVFGGVFPWLMLTEEQKALWQYDPAEISIVSDITGVTF